MLKNERFYAVRDAENSLNLFTVTDRDEDSFTVKKLTENLQIVDIRKEENVCNNIGDFYDKGIKESEKFEVENEKDRTIKRLRRQISVMVIFEIIMILLILKLSRVQPTVVKIEEQIGVSNPVCSTEVIGESCSLEV